MWSEDLRPTHLAIHNGVIYKWTLWVNLAHTLVEMCNIHSSTPKWFQVFCYLTFHLLALEMWEPLPRRLEGAHTVLVEHGPQEIRGTRNMGLVVGHREGNIEVVPIHAVLYKKEAPPKVTRHQATSDTPIVRWAHAHCKGIFLAVGNTTSLQNNHVRLYN